MNEQGPKTANYRANDRISVKLRKEDASSITPCCNVTANASIDRQLIRKKMERKRKREREKEKRRKRSKVKGARARRRKRRKERKKEKSKGSEGKRVANFSGAIFFFIYFFHLYLRAPGATKFHQLLSEFRPILTDAGNR